MQRSSLNETRAVTFDVGGTLIDPWPSVGHVYAAVAARHRPGRLDPELVNRRFAAAWRERANDFDYSRDTWAAIVATTLAGLSPLATDPHYFADLYEHFAGAAPWRIYRDVVPTLEALRDRGLQLAVISNWDLRLRPLLSALGLSGYFDPIIVSAELGVHKPSPKIFGHALARLGVPPSAALHVGDSLTDDVAGAARAGLRALRIDREGVAAGERTINSLRELVINL